MKVSFFTSTRERCGIADYSRSLLDALRDDVEVEVVAAERVRDRDGYRALGRAMNDADVAHVQYEHGFFLLDDAPAENLGAFLREVRVPLVATLHALPLDGPSWRERLEDPSLGLIVHSREQLRRVRAQGARGAVELLPVPVSAGVVAEGAAARFRAAHRLEGKLVLAVSGFTKRHKGYDLALEALGQLPEHAVLLVAGGPQDERDGADLAEILARASELGLSSRVAVTGYLAPAELGAALAASDVVLAPFRSMTASASVAMALGLGRPVVGSALDPLVELADGFGCIRLFARGDALDLARQVGCVLGDATLREALVAGARRYRERVSFASLAALSRSLYERASPGARRHAAGR